MLRDDDRGEPVPVAHRPAALAGDRLDGWSAERDSESRLLSEAAEVEARRPDAPPPGDLPGRSDEGRKPDQDKSEEPQKKGGEKEADEDDDGDEKKPGFIRRHPIIVALVAIALIAIAIGGFFYWLYYVHPYESTDDAFIDSRQFAISPKVGGYITAVPVTDNQFVGPGSPIAQIDERDYKVALEQAEAQVAAAQASLKGLGPQIAAQQAQVEEAKAQVVQAQAALRFAEQDAARYQDLAARGSGTVQQAQQSTSNLQQQQANLARAQSAVTAAEKQIGSLQAQQSSGQANLQQAQAQLDQARLNLSYTTVTAAQGGRVVRLTAAKGALAQAGQALAMFVPSEIWITANYKETQITDMKPGQPVDIEVDAYPGRVFHGHIDSIQPGSGTAFSLLPAENATGNYVKVVQRVPVKIVFDNIPDDVVLGPGMSVTPKARVRDPSL